MRIVTLHSVLCGLLICMTWPHAVSGEPPTEPITRLFNGRDLDGFYTFIKNEKSGKNSDPNEVFSVVDGMLCISGTRIGYLATKTSHKNYRLVAEFKWGGKPAQGKDDLRDSGLFFHMQDDGALFPRSLEFQLKQGISGDLCLIRGAALTVDEVTKNKGCFLQPAKPFGIEKPLGEWNTIEIVANGDRVEYKLNGKSILSGQEAQPSEGRIYLQSYNAELFYRRVDLYPLK